MVSGPLPPSSSATQSGYSGAGARTEAARGEGAASVPWIGPGASMRGPEVRGLLPQVTRAFANLDTFAANQIVSEALGAFPVEKVCISLLQPALSHTGEMWAHHQLTTSERQFAENYVRGVLFAIFHKTAEHFDAPMVIVGCGPREMNDVGALVLAVFWRRAGLRVVFLGQDAHASGLVHEVRLKRPVLVALSVTTSQRIRSLNRLGKEIMHLPSPQPIFAFSGPIFARNPDLQRKINGVYLGDDPSTATWHLTNLLGMDRGA